MRSNRRGSHRLGRYLLMRDLSPPKLATSLLFTLIEVSQTMRLLWIVVIRIILTNILFIILLRISFQIIQQFLVTVMAVWKWVLTSFKCLTLSLLLLFHGFNGPAFALNCHFEQFIGRALCGGWESLSFPDSASSSPSSYPLSSYTLPVSKTTCLLQTQHQPHIFPCPIKLLFFSYSTRLTRISKWSFKVEDCFFSIGLRLLLQQPKACDLLLKSKAKDEDHALKRSQRKPRGKVAPASSQISQACHIWALDQ